MKLFNQITISDLVTEKYKGVDLIPNKEFKKHREQLEENDKFVSVVRNTKLIKIEDDELDNYKEALLIDGTHYKVSKDGLGLTKGYVAVSEDKFIRVQQSLLPFLLLFLLLLCLLLLSLTQSDKPTNNINPDESAIDWNGESPNLNTTKNQENIVIPGFYKFVSTKEAKFVPLYNTPDNTVYFEYNIFKIISADVVGVFDTELEAQEYVTHNDVPYAEIKDDTGVKTVKIVNDEPSDEELSSVPYFVIRLKDDKYEVTKEELEIVEKTDAVMPGKQIMWNPYENFSAGTYDLKFKIKTYDIETGVACQGAYQTVSGILE